MWLSDSSEEENAERIEYRFRDRTDFVCLSNDEFVERFRLNRVRSGNFLRDLSYPLKIIVTVGMGCRLQMKC